jgi:hypothetical protein
MREIRTSGSEGGGLGRTGPPYPYPGRRMHALPWDRGPPGPPPFPSTEGAVGTTHEGRVAARLPPGPGWLESMTTAASTTNWRDPKVIPEDYERIGELGEIARRARERIVEFDWKFTREQLESLRRVVYEWGSAILGRYRRERGDVG